MHNWLRMNHVREKTSRMRITAIKAPFSFRWEPLFIRCSQKAMALPNQTIGCGSLVGSPNSRSSSQPINNDIGLVIGQYLIESLHVQMTTDMISQFIVLLLLESLIVEGFIGFCQFIGKRLQQEINK